ncbi:MAG TPA: hypothetical protein DCW68_04170 [Rhodospirillaceae bacterium]|nr:MAG: hypothetical protein A2018_07355 [Alphaproteobacteria bacterium GWF2_58_20]HAU29291.1 hypothetical protein [Rhodospirillaceae bacterium]
MAVAKGRFVLSYKQPIRFVRWCKIRNAGRIFKLPTFHGWPERSFATPPIRRVSLVFSVLNDIKNIF